MAFDPESGELWEQENGDDSFSELNRVEPGFNSGWVQIMGPPERIAQFKAIETTVTPDPPDPFAPTYFGLQQLRWSPVNIANTPAQALAAPVHAAGRALQRPGVLVEVRSGPGCDRLRRRARARPAVRGRSVRRRRAPVSRGRPPVSLQPDGQPPRASGPTIHGSQDRVADNLHKWEITESESLLIGRNFGVGTDMHTGPNGNLFIVSLSNGAVYEIFRAPRGRPAR